DWYFAKLGNESERTPYTIPVERINGPLLLLTAADDQLWPSDLFGELVLERLRANEHPHQCEHICYPNAGHVLNVQGMPTTQAHLSRYGTTTLLLGGTPQKTAHAQQDAWKRTLNFLRETK
ncbi:MAG: acyl-CoA thioester hydrolase/BAAT C-terminal domain-containing protein, partial [Tumebacillaceae bacterium]